MPKWKKSSPELTARFEAALPRDPRVEPKKMFGYPCAFVSGGFFVGLHEDRVVARLPADVHAKTKALAKAAPFDPMGGRPMRGWWVVPEAIAKDEKALGKLFLALLLEVAAHPEQPSAKNRKAAPVKKAVVKKAVVKKAVVKKAVVKKAPVKKAVVKKAPAKKAAVKKPAGRAART